MNWLLVAAGGAAGALLRYAAVLALGPVARFPLATLAVNAAGSAALGLLTAWLLTRATDASHALGLFLGVGLLGGFTTFSTFSMDTLALLHDGRIAVAGVNVAANVVVGLGAAGAGWVAGRAVFGV